MVAVGIALAVGAGIYLLRAPEPDSPGHPALVTAGGIVPTPVTDAASGVAVAADEARREETAAAYAELDASRRSLQKQLGDLKGLLWGRELPVEQARNISRDMMSAQYLLKNPPLLGAFSDAAGVYAEKDRVDAASVRLRQISGSLEGLKMR